MLWFDISLHIVAASCGNWTKIAHLHHCTGIIHNSRANLLVVEEHPYLGDGHSIYFL